MGSHGDKCTCEECFEIAKNELLSSKDWELCKGYSINTLEMNPQEYDEIFFEGKTLDKAIEDYVRECTWWSYLPSNGEQVFEDLWDAVDYELELRE